MVGLFQRLFDESANGRAPKQQSRMHRKFTLMIASILRVSRGFAFCFRPTSSAGEGAGELSQPILMLVLAHPEWCNRLVISRV